jgi:hypothetical protein
MTANAWGQQEWEDWGFNTPGPDWDFRDASTEDPKVGIEVEVEHTSMSLHEAMRVMRSIPSSFWSTVPEGSLRGEGFEFVLRSPIPMSQTDHALNQLLPFLMEAVDTFRAAVHVHFNAQPLTRHQYIGIALAYAVQEPSLYRRIGGGRDESIFCVPWYTNPSTIKALLRA